MVAEGRHVLDCFTDEHRLVRTDVDALVVPGSRSQWLVRVATRVEALREKRRVVEAAEREPHERRPDQRVERIAVRAIDRVEQLVRPLLDGGLVDRRRRAGLGRDRGRRGGRERRDGRCTSRQDDEPEDFRLHRNQGTAGPGPVDPSASPRRLTPPTWRPNC